MSRDEQLRTGQLTLVDQETIDGICLEFEDHWRLGGTPRLEQFLVGSEGQLRATLLQELLLIELSYLRERGQEPTREAYSQRFARDAEVLSIVFMPTVDAGPIYASGSKIGPYRIERLLGGGSFGEVYLAADSRQANAPVAIKVPAGGRFSSPDAVEHFLEEARTAQKLKHPAIVQASDVLRDDDGRPLIVMQFIDGVSLRQRIQSARLPQCEAVELIIQIAEAIDYAHRQGVIHRDLEPGNILLDAASRPYVADFGLAVNEQTQRARAGESAGSLAYMSPEQARGDSHWLDGRADIWSLGVILYELLSGRRPFNGRDLNEFREQIEGREAKPLRQIDGELPAELERICLKCLSKAVVDRYATGKDLADDLRRFCRLQQGLSGDTVDGAPDNSALALQAGTASYQSPYPILLGSLLAAVVMATLVLGFGFTAPGRGAGHHTAVSPSPAAKQPAESANVAVADLVENGLPGEGLAVEDIGLSVWAPEAASDRRRGEINKFQSNAAPLRIGDLIRLTVRLSEPAYVYVFWLDPDAALLPVYPWDDGKWQQLPANQQRVSELVLPSMSESYNIEPGPAGTATVFVCASREPFKFESEAPSFIRELRPQTELASAGVYWFEDGIENQLRDRAPGLSKTIPLTDPVLLNQQLLFRHLGQSANANAAICIPISGAEASDERNNAQNHEVIERL